MGISENDRRSAVDANFLIIYNKKVFILYFMAIDSYSRPNLVDKEKGEVFNDWLTEIFKLAGQLPGFEDFKAIDAERLSDEETRVFLKAVKDKFDEVRDVVKTLKDKSDKLFSFYVNNLKPEEQSANQKNFDEFRIKIFKPINELVKSQKPAKGSRHSAHNSRSSFRKR